MVKTIKQRIKAIICIILIIISIIIIKINKEKENVVAKVKEETSKESVVEISRGSKIYLENSNTEIEKNKTEEKKNIEENKKEENKETKEKKEIKTDEKSNNINLDTKDINPPDNVENIETKLIENTVIISFSRPKDNGSSYTYVVEKGEKSEKLNFYSESGVYGYSYKISNSKEDIADEKVNKLDDLPLVLEDIDFSKDYFLHIRTTDENQNFSENKTFKIDLPSKGVKIDYIDINTNETLMASETITGMINDTYNASNIAKEIPEYTLVKIDGIQEGKLEKEKINVKYEYAKKANLTIKYIDEKTNKEIIPSKIIEGYIGEEITINKPEINGYILANNNISKIKINSEEQYISILYNKVGNITISYINELTNEKLCQDDIKTLSFGSNYTVNPKEFENYEISKTPENETGILDKENITISYYYKPKFVINLKYVDIETDKVIFEEKLYTIKNKKIKYKLKEIEGYKLIYDFDNEEESVIDEIIKSLGKEAKQNINNSLKDDSLTTDEKKNIKSEYEIVMNCDDSDYIIYYKKTKEV